MKKNSKKITKIIAPLALASGCLATIPATSCGMHSSVKHIAPFLHEITYDDYREDTEYETIQEAEAFGCSSVRCGNFYGRNFDYVYNDTPEFIVRVKANKKKNRHESIAVATHFGLREDKLLKGKYHKQLELIPNLTMDGINDAGVICSSNVVSMEPNFEAGGLIPETNPYTPEYKKVHVLFLVRYVLDNASSAKDAVEKLKKVNVIGNLNKEMNIHTMIADKDQTFVVEFFKDSTSKHNHFDVIAEEKIGKDAIMTNHYLNMNNHVKDDAWKNDEKFGNERMAILQNGYDKYVQNPTFDGMTALMKTVQFSKAYQEDKPRDPMEKGTSLDVAEWYSEKVPQSMIAAYDPGSDYWKDIFNKMDQLKINYKKKVREEAKHDYWITTHNTTYDMQKKMLRVIVQEDYENWYDYYL